MNPYKKIERLEKIIEQLEHENQELRKEYADTLTLKKEYEFNSKIAEKYKNDYYRLLNKMEKDRNKVKKLIRCLQFKAVKHSV